MQKAKEIRPLIDKLITLGKKRDLHARRRATARIHDAAAVNKLFDVIADRYKDRKGGYSRVLRSGFRHGDNAALAVVELIDRNTKASSADKNFRPKGETV